MPLRGLLRRRLTGVAASLAGAYLDVALRTVRWQVIADPSARAVIDGRTQAVAVAWHEFVPYVPALWREAVRAGNPRTLHALVSRHRDGQALSRFLARWRVDIVAGSTDRRHTDGSLRRKGGGSALRRLLVLQRQGAIIGLTPDGPRGPRRVPAAGAGLLAARPGLALLPMAAGTRPSLPTGAWDRMRLPIPFARGVLVYGALFDDSGDAEIAARLDEVARRAAAALGRADR